MHSRELTEARFEEAAVRAIADLAPAAAGPHAERILALQRTAGNSAVGGMLSRGTLARPPARRLARDVPAPTPAPAPGEAAAAVAAAADWVAVVPDADDAVITEFDAKTQSQKVVHHTVKGAAAGAAPDPAVQTTIDSVCAAVTKYRDGLPGPVVTSGITSNQGKQWAGTSWTRYSGLQAGGVLHPPKATKKNPTPDDPRTDAQKQAYQSQTSYIDWTRHESAEIGTMTAPKTGEDTAAYRRWLGDRLYFDIGSMEGGFDSINVYDSQIVTWGAGLGGASGFVADAMSNMADSKLTGGGKVVGAEVTKILHAAGIAFEDAGKGRKRFVVLDPVSKRKYRGASALHLIKADNRLLMLFTNLARGELPGLDVDTAGPVADGKPGQTLKEAARRAAFEGQRHVFLDVYGGSGFKAAVDALGPTWPYDSLMMVLHLHWWGLTGWQTFKDTGGDMRAIIKKTYTLHKYVTTRNGANVAVRDLAKHLQDFGGASSKALWGPEQQLAPDKLEKDAYYVEVAPEVLAADAVPATVNAKGKVTKKGKAAVAHQDPKYRKLL